MTDTFPRQYARTQRFTLGEPRNLTVSPDEQRIVFLRSRAGDDPVNCLWVADLATGTEQLVADPVALLAGHAADDDSLSVEERARRERMREGMRNYRDLPPPLREKMRESMRAMRALPEAERKALHARWRQLSPEQRRAWLELGGPGIAPEPVPVRVD